MNSTIHRIAHRQEAFGAASLFLVRLVAALAERAGTPQTTVAGRLSSLAARRAIDGAAVIGWIADRLPQTADPRRAAGRRAPRHHRAAA